MRPRGDPMTYKEDYECSGIPMTDGKHGLPNDNVLIPDDLVLRGGR